MLDEISFEQLLYGKVMTYGIPKEKFRQYVDKEWQKITDHPAVRVPGWDKVQEAEGLGWRAFLLKHHFIPTNYSYLHEAGLFLTNVTMNNVTGVFVRFKWNDMRYFPNPFCNPEINRRGIEEAF